MNFVKDAKCPQTPAGIVRVVKKVDAAERLGASVADSNRQQPAGRVAVLKFQRINGRVVKERIKGRSVIGWRLMTAAQVSTIEVEFFVTGLWRACRDG